MPELLAWPARPDRVAIVHGDRRITWGELDREVSRLARGLRERFDPGALVALWLPNSPEILCLILACFRTGVVPMPMHLGMKGPEVDAILAHTRPVALITAADLGDLRARDEAQDLPPVASDAPALVLLTSGSKGRPKAVVLSHESIDHILRYRLDHTGLTSSSVSTVASCLTQSVGLYQSLALLAAGGTLVLLDSYDPDRLVAALKRHRPTHLILVVDAFDRLLHHPEITPGHLDRVRFASVGADRVTARVQERFIALTGRPLRVSYGLTESSWALINAGERLDKCLALGKPCPGVEVDLLDPEGHPVPVGVVGEIHIHSPRTMKGYLHDEALTREALVDGWLATGDLAYVDPDGYYWFAGRRKNLIVLATGDNVSPIEVEDVLAAHPAVSNCVVVGSPNGDGSESVWAYVTRRDDTASEAELGAFLEARLSGFKVPRRIVFLEELPVGLTGKMQRDEARLAV